MSYETKIGPFTFVTWAYSGTQLGWGSKVYGLTPGATFLPRQPTREEAEAACRRWCLGVLDEWRAELLYANASAYNAARGRAASYQSGED